MGADVRFERLMQPFNLSGIQLKNRIVMPAMSSNYVTEDGFVTDRLLDYFEARARGGVGLIIVGYVCIDFPIGLTGTLKLAIDDDKYIPGLRSLAEVIHRGGAKVALQLNHAGGFAQQSETGLQPVAPSAVVCRTDMPRALTVEEIRDLEARFAKGAERAKNSGFDGVEIHAGTNYLNAQFLSRAFNRRQDDYGGSLANRARFLLETLATVRQAVGPDYPLWSRINGIWYGVKNGTPLEEAKQVAMMLQEAGCCAISITYGYHSRSTDKKFPHALMTEPAGSQLYLAQGIKKVVSIPVMITGRMTPEAGEKALRDGTTDLVAMAKQLLADPEIPNKVATGRRQDIRPCLACDVCRSRLNKPKQCVVNASLGRERKYSILPAAKKKRVLVAGGGPAGMEAATVAALRGHSVILYERSDRLGGRLWLASRCPKRPTVTDLLVYMSDQVMKAGVKVELKRKVTPSLIEQVKPDVLVLATGSRHSFPVIRRFFSVAADIIAAMREKKPLKLDLILKSRMLKGRAHEPLPSGHNRHELLRGLNYDVPEVHSLGDWIEPAGIMEAIDDGARVGRLL